MDSITQAVLGAAIGEAMLGRRIGAKAAVAGAIIATIPDLDVICYLFYDSYDMLSIHRGFSHSILFSVLASFVVAYLLKKFHWAVELKYLRLWVFSWLALITHMLLDAFTAYGTMLLFPFSDRRVSWDAINVVDPVFTIPMILGLIFSILLFKSSPQRSLATKIGLIISVLYLLATLFVKQKVNQLMTQELKEKSIDYKSLTTMPVGIASLNWFGVARSSDSIYMHKYSFFKSEQPPFEAFPINEKLFEEIPDSYAEKMRWFAKGNYVLTRDGSKIRVYNLQVDMRGTVHEGEVKYPTVGYFELEQMADGVVSFKGNSSDK